MRFEDDGGTPAWRARRTIDQWGRTPRKRVGFGSILLAIAFVAGGLPFVILFGGLFLLAVWTSVFG